MKEELSLNTALKQQQRLTPMHLQFVKMLEMTAPEVEEAVRQAVDEMPALEVDDNSSDDESTSHDIDAAKDPQPWYRYHDIADNSRNEYDPLASAPDHDETLMESLQRQLAMTTAADGERTLATYIIGNLDSNGYITRDLDSIAADIASRTTMNPGYDDMESAWRLVRSLDPAGVAAADLRDCLSLQLKRLIASLPASDVPRPLQVASDIVNQWFDIYSQRHFDRLKAAMDIDDATLEAADAVIRRLNPKPGASFPTGNSSTGGAARTVVPDYAVDIDGDEITLRSLARIPALAVEKTFREDTPIDKGREISDTTLFIKRKRDEALGFIKLVNMRRDTLWLVMQAIVKIQRDYLLTGDEASIRPMILKDIEKMTGLGLSVISRAASGKYLATPHGMVAVKSLFNERPNADSDVSSAAITSALKALIDNEDKKHPYSDDALTSKLAAQGYDIARRTVAKYRERLGIPVARLRKSLKPHN